MKIDNFALTMFQTCPAKYLLRIQNNWTTRRKSAALGFGGAFHEGLAEWYRTKSRSKALVAIDEAWPANLPIDDWRTKAKCVETMLGYVREYPEETFSIVGAGSGNPLVEVTFTLPTGMFLPCPGHWEDTSEAIYMRESKCWICSGERELIEYGGIFDALVEASGMVYVLEHKTTSQLGSYYFRQFKPNNQVTGYVWGASVLSGRKVGGAIINAIGVYKSSASKFERQITTRTPGDIELWLRSVFATCVQIKDCQTRGAWPMHTGSCTMYGACEFHDVHVLSTETEQQKRLEQDYVQDEWIYEERAGVKEE